MRKLCFCLCLGSTFCNKAATKGDDGPTSAGTSTGSGGSDSGAPDPCDEIDGTVPQACSDWMTDQCAQLDAAACVAHEVRSTAAGELGCALAHPLDAAEACEAGPPVCVAGLHTGEGPQGSRWFSGEDVYEVPCDETALPCPAVIVFGWSSCGLEAGAPGVCDCT